MKNKQIIRSGIVNSENQKSNETNNQETESEVAPHTESVPESELNITAIWNAVQTGPHAKVVTEHLKRAKCL